MSKKPKLSHSERKLSSTLSAFHAQNKHQLREISKAKIKVELPQVPVSNLYMYTKKTWVHKGQTCRLCGVIMDHPTVIDKHRYICKVLNKKKGDD